MQNQTNSITIYRNRKQTVESILQHASPSFNLNNRAGTAGTAIPKNIKPIISTFSNPGSVIGGNLITTQPFFARHQQHAMQKSQTQAKLQAGATT